ncbi:MAG: NRDE family protein [Deltaproteobacteria bacterium]|nr:NRDE family protein [Deltaproteobacteria bacterium]
MCTVLLAFQQVAGWPLVVANNRDEFLDRRALPPRVYRAEREGGRRWLACRDLSGGGSWWGYNDRGLMVFLTNRWTGDHYAPGSRSRGRLVLELLQCSEIDEAREGLDRIAAETSFNPFNVIVASRYQGFFFSNFPELHYFPLSPGYHYLGNGLLDGCRSMKARSARRLFARLGSDRPSLGFILDSFIQALRTPYPQDSIPPQGFNVSFDGYGTTSSLLMAVAETEGANLFLGYCEANPLHVQYQDYSVLGLLL